MNDLLGALNATGTGVAPFGQFALDARGRMAFSSSQSPPAQLSIVSDVTARTVGGASLSAFFGLGFNSIAAVNTGFSLDQAIFQDPTRMAAGRLNLAAAPGQPALALGDGRGASALAAMLRSWPDRWAEPPRRPKTPRKAPIPYSPRPRSADPRSKASTWTKN